MLPKRVVTLGAVLSLVILLVIEVALAPVPTISVAQAQEEYHEKEYSWIYGESNHTWKLYIPINDHEAYKSVPQSERVGESIHAFGRLITTYDPTIKSMAQEIKSRFASPADQIGYALAFVQYLPYMSDRETTPYLEYPKFPIETLVDGGGDCEDTAILFATLVLAMGYDAVLIFFFTHMGVGVAGDFSGTYYEHEGVEYFYCETTGEDWLVGEFPPVLEDEVLQLITGPSEDPLNPLAPSPSDLECSISQPVVIGELGEVTGSIDPPHSGVSITLVFTKPDGTTVTHTTITDVNGRFREIYQFDQGGSWQLQASWVGDWNHQSAKSSQVRFSVVRAASSLTCDVSSTLVIVGQELLVVGVLSPAQDGVNVTLTYEVPDGTIISRTVLTGPDGEYNDTYRPDLVGPWSVRASWAGDWETEGAGSPLVYFDVKTIWEVPMLGVPMFIWIVVLGILIVVLLVAWVVIRQRSYQPYPPDYLPV